MTKTPKRLRFRSAIDAEAVLGALLEAKRREDQWERWKAEGFPFKSGVEFDVPLGEWTVTYTVILQGGALVFSEVHLHAESNVPAGGATSAVCRSIVFSEVRQEVLERIGELVATYGQQLTEPQGLLDAFGMAELAKEAAQQNAPRDEGYFTRIAARYADLVKAGNKRPVPVIAAELGRSARYITDCIRDGRKMGLLTPARKGRAEGKLTPKARRILNKQGKGGSDA
jgi:hypothetical protein